MEYRFLPNTGEFPHCIWIDNSRPSVPRGYASNRRHSSMGQGEINGFLVNTYRGDLMLSESLREWLDRASPDAYQLNGHRHTGMAVLFRRKGDAMLFKLAHGGS